jgi:uncharacterized membrane protein
MSEKRQSLGLGALALIPIVCCIGLPLVAAAGASVAVAVWVGGAVGAIVLVGMLLVVGLRLRRRHGGSLPIIRSRS